MIGWDKPYQVVRRQTGTWVKGEYVPSASQVVETVMGTFQPSRVYDYSTLEAIPGGRRYAELWRFYTDAKLRVASPGDSGLPGDLVIRDGVRYVVLGFAEWRVLQGPTNHGRYLVVNELEHVGGEITA